MEHKTYIYGLPLRPFYTINLPHGYEFIDEKNSQFRHGKVKYDKPLTKEEVYRYELIDLTEEFFEEKIEEAFNKAKKYADLYIQPKYRELLMFLVETVIDGSYSKNIDFARKNELEQKVFEKLEIKSKV